MVVSPAPTDTSTVTIIINSSIVQSNIDTALSILDSSISSSAPGATEIAAPQIESATAAISTAQTALTIAIDAQGEVAVQAAVVESATATLQAAEVVLESATADVDSQTAVVNLSLTAVESATAVVNENTSPGLTKTVYQDLGYNNAPPLGAGNIVSVTTDTDGINEPWGGSGPANTYPEDFQVKWEGIWTPTYTGTMWLYAPADDGVKLYLDDVLVINDWYDKGGGGSTTTVETVEGVGKKIEFWFYENGGGAHVGLYKNTGQGWEIIPGSEFCTTSATAEQLAALVEAQGILAVDQETLNDLIAVKEVAQADVEAAEATLSLESSELNTVTAVAQATLQTANSLSLSAIDQANQAKTSLESATSAINQAIQAEAARIAAERAAAEAEAARLAAEAKAAAEAAAKAEAERIAAEEAAAKAEAERLAAEEAAKAEAERLAAEEEARIKAEAEAKAEAERLAAEEAAKAEAEEKAAAEKAEAEAKAAAEAEAEEKRLAEEAAAKAEAERLEAEAKAKAEEKALKEAAEEGTLTEEQKEEVANNLIEEANGGPVSAQAIAAAGIEYKDLPPETPVEVRQDENGNEVIITADVAAALVLLENPAELIGELFSDPGQALQALGSIGADMSQEEREEAQKTVVAAVIAGSAAVSAAAVASTSAPSSGGSSGGGSSGGGGASGESKGIRRRQP